MSANTMVQDSLTKRREQYMGQLAMLSRKRETHRRAIDDIDNSVVILEASQAEVNRALGDCEAQKQAVAAEAKAQENPSDKPDEPGAGTQAK